MSIVDKSRDNLILNEFVFSVLTFTYALHTSLDIQSNFLGCLVYFSSRCKGYICSSIMGCLFLFETVLESSI